MLPFLNEETIYKAFHKEFKMGTEGLEPPNTGLEPVSLAIEPIPPNINKNQLEYI